jgi:UDP-N-acetylglucosamine--N-acetylmuramyl-(pentapeptide) pyrophosphoryl-undecaprenol N-acetylglucosamine transferase
VALAMKSADVQLAPRQTTASNLKSLRVLMAAGGTGGHIFPALAVAEALRDRWRSSEESGPGERDLVIAFLGTGRGMESRLVPEAGFRLHVIPAAGLKGIHGVQRLRNLLVLPHSLLRTAAFLEEFRPDVVLGMGGYLAGPAMLEAALKRVPTILVEPNAVPGLTNRLLARFVRKAAVAFEETEAFFPRKAELTGNPVRKRFYSILPKDHTPPFTFLILGGSQGSSAINQAVIASLPILKSHACPLSFIHQTGERDYNEVRQAYLDWEISAEVHSFVRDVPGAFSRADVVISRSGAAAVAELAAAGKASLLVPFPYASDNHQLANATALARAGAALIVPQAELTGQRLADEIVRLVGDVPKLQQMERAARALARPGAATEIADLIVNLALNAS